MRSFRFFKTETVSIDSMESPIQLIWKFVKSSLKYMNQNDWAKDIILLKCSCLIFRVCLSCAHSNSSNLNEHSFVMFNTHFCIDIVCSRSIFDLPNKKQKKRNGSRRKKCRLFKHHLLMPNIYQKKHL